MYVPDEDACQPITCPPGLILDESDCIRELSNITFTISGRLNPVSLVLTTTNKTELEKRIRQTVEDIMNEINITYHYLNVTTQIDVSNDNVSVTIQIHCNCDYKGGGATSTFPIL